MLSVEVRGLKQTIRQLNRMGDEMSKINRRAMKRGLESARSAGLKDMGQRGLGGKSAGGQKSFMRGRTKARMTGPWSGEVNFRSGYPALYHWSRNKSTTRQYRQGVKVFHPETHPGIQIYDGKSKAFVREGAGGNRHIFRRNSARRGDLSPYFAVPPSRFAIDPDGQRTNLQAFQRTYFSRLDHEFGRI